MRVALISAAVLAVFVVGWVAWNWRAPLRSGAVTIAVADGQGLGEIATLVSKGGVVRSGTLFKVVATVSGRARNLRAGAYTFPPGQSLGAVLETLTAGQTDERRVTLVEGWTAQQMGEALAKAGVVSAADFSAAAQTTDTRTLWSDAAFDFFEGKPTSASLEGYLFPDTYRFKPAAPAADVVRRLLENFGTRVSAALRAQAAERGRTFFEVLTLASIVEREVAKEEDRRMVADIFWRRLARPMRLESDATVNYATGKDLPSPTLADTQVESSYNTYRNDGLPPGPIGNPGLQSIQAVLNPTPNEYFYFLSGKDGTTYFARTFEGHLQNKARYLK